MFCAAGAVLLAGASVLAWESLITLTLILVALVIAGVIIGGAAFGFGATEVVAGLAAVTAVLLAS